MTYKLTYFELSARGEPIRFLLSYGGLKFEDYRITREAWPELKPSTPFGLLPILEYEGKVGHQTMAICRYLAKQVKLVGNNDWEDLEIDATVDTINDMSEKFRAKYFGRDVSSNEDPNEILSFYLTRLDERAKNNGGYLVFKRLTWADLYLVAFTEVLNLLANKDILDGYPSLQKVKNNVLSVPKIKEYIEKRPNNDAKYMARYLKK